jgi:hypothetical protein
LNCLSGLSPRSVQRLLQYTYSAYRNILSVCQTPDALHASRGT